MNFSEALDILKRGGHVRRQGWPEQGTWVAQYKSDEGHMVNMPYIIQKTARGDFVPWTADQEDTLAEDWEVVS